MQQENVAQELEVINEWDSIIIQISKGEGESSGSGAIKMMKQDIDAMMKLHGVSRGDIMEMMVKALETTPKEQMVQK
jgi:hypothetical protein